MSSSSCQRTRLPNHRGGHVRRQLLHRLAPDERQKLEGYEHVARRMLGPARDNGPVGVAEAVLGEVLREPVGDGALTWRVRLITTNLND